MALRLQQVLKQTQRLIMTPQMQQSIQLLQLNSMELEQMIHKEMLENPFLELVDDEENLRSQVEDKDNNDNNSDSDGPEDLAGLSDQAKEEAKASELDDDSTKFEESDKPDFNDDPNSERETETSSADDFDNFQQNDVDWNEEYQQSDTSSYASTREDIEENDFTTYTAIGTNLYDSLMRQLRLSILDGRELEIGEFIVGNLGEDGFLDCKLETQCLTLGYPPDLIESKNTKQSEDRLREILLKLQGEGNREHIEQLKRKQLVATIVGELLRISADEAMAMKTEEWQLRLIARRLKMKYEEVLEFTKEDLILETYAHRLKTDSQTIFDVLEVIHDFEPTGVGARNLAECLRLQCEEKGIRNRLLYQILEEHLSDLQQKRFREIARALEVPENQVVEVFHIVAKLDPRPGQSTTKETTRYIKPDVYVKKVDGKFMYFLNEGDAGKLRVASDYKDMVPKKTRGRGPAPQDKKVAAKKEAEKAKEESQKIEIPETEEEIEFIGGPPPESANGVSSNGATANGTSASLNGASYNAKNETEEEEPQDEGSYANEKFKNAVWLIKNIEKRKSTVLRVTEAIMNYQQDFLEKGIEHLHPLTLRNIAEVVNMHESTIARVTTGKYVETPRGIFELKFFFSSGLETDSGEDASSRAIKEMITQMIDQENEKKPLSDQKIADMLKDKGIQIARRTVAKYREQLKILPAKLRKQVKVKV